MKSLQLETLHRIRDKIANHWIKGDYARDASGDDVDTTSPKACTWCLVGAIESETLGSKRPYFEDTNTKDTLYYKTKKLITDVAQVVNLESYNDKSTTTKEDILAIVDKAIASCVEHSAQDTNSTC